MLSISLVLLEIMVLPNLSDIETINLDIHLLKLQSCFDKCREFDRNLNPKKCMFLVQSCIILKYVVSKESKLPNPKTNLTIVHMLTPKTTKDIQFFNGMAHYY